MNFAFKRKKKIIFGNKENTVRNNTFLALILMQKRLIVLAVLNILGFVFIHF